ncbi:MAG: adenylosuccinate lyase [Candidatus Krumholzibacteria bacterium]|nr:adenylosuccinate lyase [Candidatus Krumholzibacteria bacterium]
MIPRYSLPEIAEIWTDEHRFGLWQEIEVLYCEGLAAYGHIPKKAAREIRRGAGYDAKRVLEIEKRTRHDVIAFLTDMAEHVGESGKYLHLGMTSSDLLDTALACQMREAGLIIQRKLGRLRTVLRRQALRYRRAPMVGRTHGVHAEPITMGLKLLVWYEEIDRHAVRLRRAIEEISVGQITGAVGTMSHTDHRVERYVMSRLGLKAAPVTTQIIPRDRHAQYLTALALIGASLEKMAVEIRGLQRTEIGEAEEPFTKGQKGSSAMPHKRNPILTERIAGMARLLRGNALASIENVALWHERDISHSSVERVIIPDSTMIAGYMIEKFAWVAENMRVNRAAMMRNLELTGGLVFSQALLLLLVRKGLSREAAYETVQGAAMKSIGSGRSIREHLAADGTFASLVSERELDEAFDLDAHLRNVDFIFSRVLSRRGRPRKGPASC